MISTQDQYVIPVLRQRQSLEIIVFMQNSALPHVTRQGTALLQTHFGEELVISIGFPTACPYENIL